MTANTASVPNGRDDFAYAVDHQADRTDGYMGDTPDTIGDPEGAKARLVAAQTPQLPGFVTEDFTPRFNPTSGSWSLVPKETSIKFLTEDVAEVWKYQSTREELQTKAKPLASAFVKLMSSVGQWSAMGIARSNIREQSRSLTSGVRTSISAYNWSTRLLDNNDDTAPAESLTESAQSQIDDAVVLLLAVIEAAETVLEGEANLGFSDIDWTRAARDALSFEGARHAKKNLDALNPTAAVERKRSSARAALGALKGAIAA